MSSSILPSFEPTNELNWSSWLTKGDQYLKAATPKGPKSKFGPDVLYNLLAMAFESYAMAIADRLGTLPHNHTFTDLIQAIDGLVDLPDDVRKCILDYEDCQSICSVEAYHRDLPGQNDLELLKTAIETVGKMAHDTCKV